MSATNPDHASDFEAPLTRREIREREAALEATKVDATVIVEDVEPVEVPVAPPSDSGLPSLFGDDKKEEVKEAPVVPASYAREAPAAKYLEGQPLVDFDSTSEVTDAPQTLQHMQHQNHHESYHHMQPMKQHHAPSTQPRQESWTTGAMIKVVAFSLLYAGLTVAMFAVPMVMLVAEAATTAP
jgi:hypothetical protein